MKRITTAILAVLLAWQPCLAIDALQNVVNNASYSRQEPIDL